MVRLIRTDHNVQLDARLALLPLTNLLVEGNTFRVPQRKVWEREGRRHCDVIMRELLNSFCRQCRTS